ncbi:hypothetical protein ACFYQA_30510 [Streptomyces sp. NPDC005774]|uniref:hypothetical protein n=1 Tax=Streptomyces sp. NPDC005774 TaxID=3364728 RepID=UPI0036CF4F46
MTDSTDETLRAARTAFARLARENPGPTDIDRRIMRAFEQLMLGRPEITDGRTSAVNICAEAGVSRASYYRSPVSAAIKEVLGAPQAKRPEADELRQEIAQLKKTMRELHSDKATEIRELRSTLAAYANQIQILTLRNAELESDARQLRQALSEQHHSTVTPLR